MGGKGSGRYHGKGSAGKTVPYEQNPVWQASDAGGVNPDTNSRILQMGKELLALPEIQFDDVEVVKQRFFDYLDLCDKYHLKPMIVGMLQALGISSTTWYNILEHSTRESRCYRGLNQGVFVFLKKINDFMQFCWENYLMEEEKNPVKWIFLGKNYFGYEDSTVRVQRAEVEQMKLGDPSEIAARYAKMLGKPTSEVIEIEPIEVTTLEG